MTRPTETHTVEINGESNSEQELNRYKWQRTIARVAVHKRDASWLKGNRHKIAYTRGSSLISTKKLVSMGKLLTRCCRKAVAKALNICRSYAMWIPRQRNWHKPCRCREHTVTGTTHDSEYRIHTVTVEKRQKRVSRQETWRGRRIEYLFLLFGCGVYCSDWCAATFPFLLFFTKLNRIWA
jgi:hypothetical protein